MRETILRSMPPIRSPGDSEGDEEDSSGLGSFDMGSESGSENAVVQRDDWIAMNRSFLFRFQNQEKGLRFHYFFNDSSRFYGLSAPLTVNLTHSMSRRIQCFQDTVKISRMDPVKRLHRRIVVIMPPHVR